MKRQVVVNAVQNNVGLKFEYWGDPATKRILEVTFGKKQKRPNLK